MHTMSNGGLGRFKDLPESRVARAAPLVAGSLTGSARDEMFLSMLSSFRRSGGLARQRDMAALSACRPGPDAPTLAKWILEAEVIHFDWEFETWLPLFQFDTSDRLPSADVGMVLKELAVVYDAWESAQWFASPSSALAGQTPADAIQFDPDSVLRAARICTSA
jgi:hypothetical protein